MEIYNTLIRSKETFTPRDPGKVNIYVCGPTTYNYIHLGNARPLVFFDTVRRYFQFKGFQVRYVQNFTDIDDKIINRASEEGEDPLNLARKYIREFFIDADALNVKRADVYPRVTEHMEDIIGLVQMLIANGSAYETEGDVYFDINSFAGYGKLSGRAPEEMFAGARVEVDPRKKNPMDFALWKAAKPGEPFWESPWGRGRPGWHIECSAMSLKYLGSNFDIHGGGADLIFPHHENEIAQAEAATGKPFVRYWMHNGFITINQEKMSKSLGNFFLTREVLSKFKPLAVRFFLLSTHYRSPLDFNNDNLAAASRGWERLQNGLTLLMEALGRKLRDKKNERDEEYMTKLNIIRQQFMEAMDDDFNTAFAIGINFELVKESNTYLQEEAVPCEEALQMTLELYAGFNETLGIFRTDGQGKIIPGDEFSPEVHPLSGLEQATGATAAKAQEKELVAGLINLLLRIREEARAKKNWAMADRIREGLKELGILIEDTRHGSRWKRVSE